MDDRAKLGGGGRALPLLLIACLAAGGAALASCGGANQASGRAAPPTTSGTSETPSTEGGPSATPPISLPFTGPPSKPPTTVRSSPTSEEDQQCDARAQAASITYRPSETMTLDQATEVEVTASTGTSAPALSSGAKRVLQPLQCRVRARLYGNDFDLSPPGWDERTFLGVDQVSWQWSVTPHTVGNREQLNLQVQGLVQYDDGSSVPAGPEFQRIAQITVDTKPKSLSTKVSHAVSAIGNPLLVSLLSAAIIALGGWVLHRLLKRAKGGESDDSAAVDLRAPSATPDGSPHPSNPERANLTDTGADSTP